MPEQLVEHPTLADLSMQKPQTQPEESLYGEARGTPGTRIFAGIIKEEWRGTLNNYTQLYDEINRMRFEHGAAHALLQIVKLPLMAAKYDIVPASQDPRHLEQAALARHNLIDGGLGHPFRKFQREALTYIDFGFSVFEPIWRRKDFIYRDDSGKTIKVIRNMKMIHKFGFRSQRTIQYWLWTQDNKFNGAHQMALDPKGRSVNIDLFVPDILVYTHQMEGDNFIGWPLGRAMYPHWKRIEETYWIELIGIIKNAIGFPYMQEKDIAGVKANKEDFDSAEDFVRLIQAGEQMSGAIGRLWDLKELEGKINTDAIHNQIMHQLTMMALSVLADFTLLGTMAQTGAFNVADVKRDYFDLSEEDRVSVFVDNTNEYAIKRIIDENYDVTDGMYPKLKCMGISKDNLAAWAQNAKTLIDSMLVTPDRPLKEFVRAKFDFPKIDDATAEPVQSQAAPLSPVMMSEKISLSEKRGGKHLLELLDKNDAVEKKFLKAQDPVYETWQKELVKQVKEGKDPDELSIPPALIQPYAKNLEEAFFKAEVNGAEGVQTELGKKIPSKQWLSTAKRKAEAAGRVLARKDAHDLEFTTGLEMVKRVGRKKVDEALK